MSRRGKPGAHQADTLGHVHTEERRNGIVVGHVHKWFARCRCGWECKYTRGTKEAALGDHRLHVTEESRTRARA